MEALLLAVVLADPRALPRRVWQGALIAVLILLAIRQGMIYYRKKYRIPDGAVSAAQSAVAEENDAPDEEKSSSQG